MQAVLKATVEAIAEYGADSLSMSDLAQRAEVSRPTIYSLIGSADGALAELWLHYGKQWIQSLEGGQVDSLPKRIDNAMVHLILVAPRHSELLEVLQRDLQLHWEEREKNGEISLLRYVWALGSRIGANASSGVSQYCNIGVKLLSRVNELPANGRLAVGLDGQKKWAKIPVPQTPTAELDGDDITNRLVVAVIDVVNSSGVAGLSMLRVCRVAGVTTGAGKPRFEDTDDLLMASFDAFINNVVSNNIMTVAKKSSVLGLVDLYAEFIIAGLSSSRKRWFRFRQEIYLASKTNLLVRRKIKKTVSIADQQLEKLLMSDAYKLDKKQVATILGLNQILSVGMPALFSLGLPVDKIDHRIPLRWIFS